MVRLARFLSSGALLGLVACHEVSQPALPLMNAQGLALYNEGGLMKLDGKPLNARVYTLYPEDKDSAEVRSYRNGKEEGWWTRYYPDGRMQERRYFHEGKKEGRFQAWWPDGKPQLDYYFLNDEYEGACTEWNDSGRLVKLMHYHQGREEGRQQWWYDNGKTKANYLMVEGRRYGLLGTKNCVNVSDSIFQ